MKYGKENPNAIFFHFLLAVLWYNKSVSGGGNVYLEAETPVSETM